MVNSDSFQLNTIRYLDEYCLDHKKAPVISEAFAKCVSHVTAFNLIAVGAYHVNWLSRRKTF